jgi:hypothetical protein
VQLQISNVFTDDQFKALTKTEEWYCYSAHAFDTLLTDPARKVFVLKQQFGSRNWQVRPWPDEDGIRELPVDGAHVVGELARALTLAGRLAQRVPGLHGGHQYSHTLLSLLLALPAADSAGEAAVDELLEVLAGAQQPFYTSYFGSIVC